MTFRLFKVHSCIINSILKIFPTECKEIYFVFIFQKISKRGFFYIIQYGSTLSKVSWWIFPGSIKMNIDVWIPRTLGRNRWFITKISNIPVKFHFIGPNRNFVYYTNGQYSRSVPSWPRIYRYDGVLWFTRLTRRFDLFYHFYLFGRVVLWTKALARVGYTWKNVILILI